MGFANRPTRRESSSTSGGDCARTLVIHDNDAIRAEDAFRHLERRRDRNSTSRRRNLLLCWKFPKNLPRTEILGLRQGEQANAFDIEWLHRMQLEARLRDIIDAQDRLLDGTYGKCVECGEQITVGRLTADPAASLCLYCRKLVESEYQFCRGGL